jgi:Flp pilus assembly protein TadG
MFAIIDFGRYVYYVQVLNNAAREGTRYAIVHGYNSFPSSGPPASGTTSADPAGDNVRAVVRNYAVGVVGDATTLSITPSWDPDNGRESTVTVIVTYQFTSVIPVVPIPPIEVKGESTLVINN